MHSSHLYCIHFRPIISPHQSWRIYAEESSYAPVLFCRFLARLITWGKEMEKNVKFEKFNARLSQMAAVRFEKRRWKRSWLWKMTRGEERVLIVSLYIVYTIDIAYIAAVAEGKKWAVVRVIFIRRESCVLKTRLLVISSDAKLHVIFRFLIISRGKKRTRREWHMLEHLTIYKSNI